MAKQMTGGKPRFGAIRGYADGGQVRTPPPTSFRGLFNSAKNAISNAMAPETQEQGQARRAAEYEAKKAKYGSQPTHPAQPSQPSQQPPQGVNAGLDGAGGSSLDNRMKAAGAYADGGIVKPVGAFRRGGRVMSAQKKSDYSSGAKLKGPGTAESDDIDAEIVETGEPIRVANGERILSAEQEKYMQEVAKLSGHSSVDDMLRMGTGKPVGPTIKYVPGGARRAAAGGMLAIGSGSATDDRMANQMAQPLKPTNLQDAVADASFNSMSGIATQDRLNGNNVEEAQLRINNGPQDFTRQSQKMTNRVYSDGGVVMSMETDEEGANKTFVSRNGGKTELLSPMEIANSEKSLNQYREDERMIKQGANPLLNVMANVPEFSAGGKVRCGAVRRGFSDGGSIQGNEDQWLLGQIPTGGVAGRGPTPAAQQPVTTYEDKFMPATRAVVSGAADDVVRNIQEKNFGAAVGNAVRGSAGVGPAIIADSWRPWGGAARQAVNAASTAFGGSETPMGPVGKQAQPVAQTSQPAQASYSNEGRNGTKPQDAAGALRAGSKSTDVGFGVTRIDEPGKSPLFTNLEGGADHASNVALMNRKPMTTQDSKALDNLTAKYDAQVRGALAAEQFARESEAAQRLNADNLRIAERQAREGELKRSRGEAEVKISSRNALPSERTEAQRTIDSLNAASREQAARNDAAEIAGQNRDLRMRELDAHDRRYAAESAERQARGALDRARFGIEQAREGREAGTYTQQQEVRTEIKRLTDQHAKETNPEQRQLLENRIRVLSGKDVQPQFKSHVIPSTKHADGSTSPGGVYVENTRTGQGNWVNQKLDIYSDPEAAKIKADTSMTTEQKKDALSQLGYK